MNNIEILEEIKINESNVLFSFKTQILNLNFPIEVRFNFLPNNIVSIYVKKWLGYEAPNDDERRNILLFLEKNISNLNDKFDIPETEELILIKKE